MGWHGNYFGNYFGNWWGARYLQIILSAASVIWGAGGILSRFGGVVRQWLRFPFSKRK